MDDKKNPLGRKRIFKTVAEFDDLVVEYMDKVTTANNESLKKTGKLVMVANIAALCLYMGIVKDTFYAYAHKVDDNGFPFSDSVKKASLFLEQFNLERGSLGHINPIYSIFVMKNNFSEWYKDKQEITVETGQDCLTAKDIEDKLKKIRQAKPKDATKLT